MPHMMETNWRHPGSSDKRVAGLSQAPPYPQHGIRSPLASKPVAQSALPEHLAGNTHFEFRRLDSVGGRGVAHDLDCLFGRFRRLGAGGNIPAASAVHI